ncbi:haloacid dehalogenase type II [Histidinibacterium lentulum]|uniref:(S)-2-haloacid dehalogenase n=1 Tax=Histidinibacterium lentulum TaxID=2480588 RepID=A0A3N2QS86_9RHOB|nr:haloacid dehalogenase type II [Histidinibacterium lentulum]ROT98081.1 haloacid dehalogenase type II [Histidinibacterium lentulum]
MATRVCIFDAYGTLLDVDGAARAAAAEPDSAALAAHWPDIARDWRAKQLQYTWLRSLAGHPCDFWQVTCDGLDWALEAAGLQGDAALRARLLQLYRVLPAYPEAGAMLEALAGRGIPAAILSNGDPEMLEEAVAAAGLGGALAAILSARRAGVFKPSPRVYDLVGEAFDARPDEVLFVSSNGWDAAGAAGYGFRTLWVNRAGQPAERLHAMPHHEARDLNAVTELI